MVSKPSEAPGATADRDSPAIHVVLVHGIGDVRVGEVLDEAAAGISRKFGDARIERAPTTDPPYEEGEHSARRSMRVHLADVDVLLTEYHWKSQVGKIRLRRPLDAAYKVLEVVKDVPYLGLSAPVSVVRRWFAGFFGWINVLLIVAGVLAALAFAAELAWRPEGLGSEGSAPPFMFSLVAVPLGLAVFLALIVIVPLVLVGLRNVVRGREYSPWSLLLRATLAASLVGFIALFLALYVGLFLALMGPALRKGPEAWLGLGVLLLLAWLVVLAGLGYANLLRDVVLYLATDNRGAPLGRQLRIQDELLALLEQSRDRDPGARIVLVTHSMGTVIAVDLLRRLRDQPRRGVAFDLDLVTAGSPLRRLISRYLPHRAPPPIDLRKTFASEGNATVKRWFNCYRILDYVGQRLVPRRIAGAGPEASIRDYRLAPVWNRRFAHANYWRDERFIDFIAQEVLGPVLTSRQG